MTISEIIYGIFFQPVPTLQYLSREKPLVQAMVAFVLVLGFNAVINRGIGIINTPALPVALPDNLIWVFIVVGVFLSLITLFIMAAFYSLLSEVIYGQGNASGLLVCLGFASVPGVLGPPLQYAAILNGLKGWAVILPLLSFVWVVVLQVLSLREALGLDTGKAVLLFVLPVLLVLGLGTVMITMLVSTLPHAF